jgi:hypothetical protein
MKDKPNKQRLVVDNVEHVFDAWEDLANAANDYASDSSVENAKMLRELALAYARAKALL